MKSLRVVAILMILAGLAFAQDAAGDVASSSARDLLSVAQSDESLSMFVSAIQSSGMAKMLREEGPFTVFALSNRAFANLPKKDMEVLLTNRTAMHVLLARYIVRGNVSENNTAELESARTLLGVKLRTDVRSEGEYINGAKLNQPGISCGNGMIFVLDRFDPALVHEAVSLANRTRH